MTRSNYCFIVLVFSGYMGQLLLVLDGYHPLADQRLLRFGSENVMDSMLAISILAGWSRATFLRICDMGAQRKMAYLLCTAALVCLAVTVLLWICAGHKWNPYRVLLVFHLPIMLIKCKRLTKPCL